MAMSLAARARELADSAAPELTAPAPTPADLVPLLGLYAPFDMSFLLRVEWRDGELGIVESQGPGGTILGGRGGEPSSVVVAPRVRPSGGPVILRRPAAP